MMFKNSRSICQLGSWICAQSLFVYLKDKRKIESRFERRLSSLETNGELKKFVNEKIIHNINEEDKSQSKSKDVYITGLKEWDKKPTCPFSKSKDNKEKWFEEYKSNLKFEKFVKDILDKSANSEDIELNSHVEKVFNGKHGVCDQLRKHDLFKEAKCSIVGSCSDNTNIKRIPDELDIIIDMPSLDKYFNYDTGITDERDLIPIHLQKHVSKFTKCIPEAELNADSSFGDLWNYIRLLITKYLIRSTKDSPFLWVDTPPNNNTHHAFTYLFWWEGKESRVISLDVCLRSKVTKDSIRSDKTSVFQPPITIHLRKVKTDKNDENDKTDKNDDNDKNDKISVILNFDRRSRIPEDPTSIDKWSNLPKDDGKKKVLRASKLIASRYFPHVFNPDTLRMEPFLSSFWLKTLVLYLSDHYRENPVWKDEILSRRIWEVFQLLQKCFEEKCLLAFYGPYNTVESVIRKEEKMFNDTTERCREVNDLFTKFNEEDKKKLETKVNQNNKNKKRDTKLKSFRDRLQERNPEVMTDFDYMFSVDHNQ